MSVKKFTHCIDPCYYSIWTRQGGLMSKVVKVKYLLAAGLFTFITYFGIQNLVVHEYDFMTSFDKMIPFMPEFVWIYHSIWFVILGTMMLLVKSRVLFLNMIWSAVMATFIIHLCYVLFPSFYPRPEFVAQSISEKFLQVSYELDKGGSNTFPSGHVAYAWLIYFGIVYSEVVKKIYGLRRLYLLWAIGITLSTLVTKVHYIVDIFGGLAVAIFCFFFVRAVLKRIGVTERNEKDNNRQKEAQEKV